MLEFEVKVAPMKKHFDEVEIKAVKKAMVHSANRTATSVRTFTIEMLKKKTGMKPKALRRLIWITRATAARPEAKMKIRNTGMRIDQLKPRRKVVRTDRGKRYGVTAEIRGSRVFIPGAFMARYNSAKRGVYERKGHRRMPIIVSRTEGLADVFRQSEVTNQVTQVTAETLRKNFERDYEYYKRKLGGVGG